MVQHPSQCEDGYLEWYLDVSHPRIIPSVEDTDDIGPFDVGIPVDNISPPPPTVDVDDQQRLQMIVVIIDNLMDLVNSYGKIYVGLTWAAYIACERSI